MQKKNTALSAAIQFRYRTIQLKYRTLHVTAPTPSFLRDRIIVCISAYCHCTSIISSKGNIARMLLPISVNKYMFKLKQFTVLHTVQA